MRGHLRKRGDRAWAIVVDIGHDPRTGKRRQKWVNVNGTKREAERKLVEVVLDRSTGAYIQPSRLTISEFLDQWMQDYVATSVRPGTAGGYRTIVNRLQRTLGHVRLTGLHAQDVQRYYKGLLDEGLSAQTVIHHHRVLRQAISQAVKWDLLSKNVMERVTPPKRVKPKLSVLEAPEVQQLLQAARRHGLRIAHPPSGSHRFASVRVVWTVLVRSEPRGSDLDGGADNGFGTGDPVYIGEPKSSASRRVVSFSKTTAELLRDRRASLEEWGLALQTQQVCTRGNRQMMMPDALSRGHKAISESCGFSNLRFHDLRHTHATLLLTSGTPIHVVQARLGHASIQTTVDTYGHVLPASDVEAGRILEQQLGR